MRIAFFTRCLPEHGLGGMEIHAAQVARGLVAHGHEVVVYTTRLPHGTAGGPPTAARSGVSNTEVDPTTPPHPPAPHTPVVRYLPDTRPRSYLGGYWPASRKAFLADHRSVPFDVAYSESAGGFGLLGMKEAPVPTVVFLVGTAGMELRSKLRRTPTLRSLLGAAWNVVNLIQSRRLLPRAARILCESDGLRTWALREMPLDPGRVSVGRLGVDTQRFTPEGPTLPALSSLTGTRILMGGRLEAEKGFDIALEALTRLAARRDDFSVALVGSGSQETALRTQAQSLAQKGRFAFSPPIPHDRLAEMYRAARIYLMPTRRHEGSALSIVEAMACGCVVVASRIGGLATLFEEGEDGLLAAPDDAAAWEHQIEALLDDPAACTRIARAARETARTRYDLAFALDRIEDCLRAAAAIRGASS
ncbi:MAG: glycosyltransferase family 4 protein [Candidatus Eisenbacteria bacterium]|uniref:Glycosyltransferase family 4 protein n=1 Tax=Eiseniibacteriota bacterium TaxID=2212470 RepID=A0A956RSU9_UNCEI|nr:glycosyltransferase family 4 protein [Candidatus Eisenbacteria bacterium]